jgi:hypothetical protein
VYGSELRKALGCPGIGGGAAMTSSPPAYLIISFKPTGRPGAYLMLSRFLIASPTLLFLAFNLLVLLLEPCSSRRDGFWGLGVGAVDGIYTEGRRRDAISASKDWVDEGEILLLMTLVISWVRPWPGSIQQVMIHGRVAYASSNFLYTFERLRSWIYPQYPKGEYNREQKETENSIRIEEMADVMMAESSSASLSRRQHLANTFEAYRAGLDADVSSQHSL